MDPVYIARYIFPRFYLLRAPNQACCQIVLSGTRKNFVLQSVTFETLFHWSISKRNHNSSMCNGNPPAFPAASPNIRKNAYALLVVRTQDHKSSVACQRYLCSSLSAQGKADDRAAKSYHRHLSPFPHPDTTPVLLQSPLIGSDIHRSKSGSCRESGKNKNLFPDCPEWDRIPAHLPKFPQNRPSKYCCSQYREEPGFHLEKGYAD